MYNVIFFSEESEIDTQNFGNDFSIYLKKTL